MKTGLVLEGGAQRGVFTAGVLDKLMEEEIEFPYVIAVSAGACNAYSFLSKQKGRTIRCMTARKEDGYFGIGELLRTGRLMNLEKVFHGYPILYPFDYDTYFASRSRAEYVATSMETGLPHYFTVRKCRYRLARVGMASCAMPLFASPVKIAGVPYLDGGVADSIPARRAMEQGCDKILAVLTRQEGNTPSDSEKMKKLYCRYFRRYPEFARVLCRRGEMYKEQIAYLTELERAGKAFVIRPTVSPVSRMESDREKLLAFYQHGYDSMAAKMDSLRAFLKE